MSERDFNPSANDRRILALLDDLQKESPLSVAPAPQEDEASREADRPYLEMLGMMPYALEQPELPKELGERILSKITQPQDEAASAEPDQLAEIESFDQASIDHHRRAAEQMRPPLVNRWLLPLAAGLTALFVGLSTWQFYKIEAQSEMIAAISAELSAQNALNETLAAMKTRLESTTDKLSLVTAPGVAICALRPVGAESMYPSARGVLWVAEDHQHWYLAMEGLQPRPRGESYQLWFHADAGIVDAGTFRVVPGTKMELSSKTMPLGTKAVSITLEPAGGMPQPTGQEVLYGSEVMQIF